jgi:hypothetical protein
VVSDADLRKQNEKKDDISSFFLSAGFSHRKAAGFSIVQDPEPWIRIPGSGALDPDSINMDPKLTVEVRSKKYRNTFRATLPVQHA